MNKNKKRKNKIIFFSCILILLIPLAVLAINTKRNEDLTKIWKLLFETDKYYYNPIDKPDPFRPFIYEEKGNQKTRKIKSPLEQIDISEIKLVGIIKTKNQKIAILEDDTGKGYFVQVGTPIGLHNGIIKAIKDDKIIIEEKATDFTGRITKRKIILKLRPAEEENE